MMLKKEVAAVFKKHYRDQIIEEFGENDHAAMRQAWNDFVDSLVKDGLVSETQANRWVNPFVKKENR